MALNEVREKAKFKHRFTLYVHILQNCICIDRANLISLFFNDSVIGFFFLVLTNNW